MVKFSVTCVSNATLPERLDTYLEWIEIYRIIPPSTPVIIISMGFRGGGGENFSPPFEKEVKRGNYNLFFTTPIF